MTPRLYGHKFSSCTWKALIGLYEAEVAFDFHGLGAGEDDSRFRALQPLGKFPVLEADDGVWMESSVIVEWADRRRAGGAALIPADPELALEARMLDRLCDGHLITPTQTICGHRMDFPGHRDPDTSDVARAKLAAAYAWLEGRLDGREWLVGTAFSLADASAAPGLFYADWVAPLGEHPHLAAYLRRLRGRPSVARCVDEARPYRALFPGGVPAHAD